MKKCINAWAFPGGLALEEQCRQAKAAGFEAIELNMAESGPVHLGMTEQEAGDVLRTVHQSGLVISSLSTGLFWQYPLTSADAETVEKAKEIVRQMLQAAKWLENDAILVVPGTVTSDVSYDDAYERAQSGLKAVAPDAERLGVHIGVENVWNKFLLSPLEMARFLDEIGSSHVGAYFDVGNVQVFGFPEQWIRNLGSRIRRIHLKDFKNSVGNINGFCNLLEGDLNWPEVKKALQGIGYNGFVTAEMGGYRHYPEQLLRDTANAISLWLNGS
jgi:hexulose-6-phosphate isomerase